MKLRFISMLGRIVGIADDETGERLPLQLPVATAPMITQTDNGYHITGGDDSGRHKLLVALRDHYGANVIIKPSGNDGAEVFESLGPSDESTYNFERDEDFREESDESDSDLEEKLSGLPTAVLEEEAANAN